MWSLSVEEQFYLIWPATILFLLKKHKNYLFHITLALLIGSLSLSQILLTYDHMFSYYMLPTRSFELLIGAVLATKKNEVNQLLTSNFSKSIASTLGLLLILSSYVFITKDQKSPGLYSLIPSIGAILIIIFGDSSGGLGKLLKSGPLVFTGMISYSLYLVHWPLFVYITYRTPQELELITKLCLFPIAFILAGINYRLIENKFRRPKKKTLLSSNRSFVTASIICIALICAPGAYNLGNKIYNKSINKLSHNTIKKGTKILVIGDSHASHLSDGLNKLFKGKDLIVDYKLLPGCPPLLGVYKIYGEKNQSAEQAKCKNFEIKGTKENLLLNSNYDVIIMAARWYWMFEPTNYGSNVTFRQDHLISSDNPTPSRTNSKKNFTASLNETIEKITNNGTKIIIFSQVPPLGNNISRCKNIFPWVKNKNSGRCEILSKQKLLERSRFTDSSILLSTKDNNLAMPIIAKEYFCKETNDTCSTSNTKGQLLYKDNNHLSKIGSIEFINNVNSQQELLKFIQN